jgi:hypothetical protein
MPPGRFMSRLKSVDFYKKIPRLVSGPLSIAVWRQLSGRFVGWQGSSSSAMQPIFDALAMFLDLCSLTVCDAVLLQRPDRGNPHRSMAIYSSCCGDVLAAGAGKQEACSLCLIERLHQHLSCSHSSSTRGSTAAWPNCAGLLPCCFQELSAFMSTQTSSELVVDRSPQNELLKITFNMR